MIELLSLGDRIEPGRYRLKCRFRGAAAFARDSGRPGGGRTPLVFLVEAGKPEGPVNIVARGVDLASIDSFEVRAGRLVLGGRELSAASRYESEIGPLPARPAALERNLRAFEEVLRREAPAGSLASLRDDAPRRTGFEAALARRLRSGINRLEAGDLEGGAAALKGLGVGLTPGGDDLLAGYLLALHALRAAFGAGVWGRVRAIQRGARTRNPFSSTFLRCAAEGRFFEPAKALALALFAGGLAEVAATAGRLVAVGATSGADLAAGLLLGLRFGLPRKGHGH